MFSSLNAGGRSFHLVGADDRWRIQDCWMGGLTGATPKACLRLAATLGAAAHR